jgi:hypothetical protein
MTHLEGGCACGAVRYRVAGEPTLSLLCFCGDCMKRSGTDGYAGMMFPEEGFEVTGEPGFHATQSDTGRTVKRHFCTKCGSNLWGQTEFGLVSIAAGSLDDPSVFSPERVVYTQQAPPWARIPEELLPADENN